MINTVQVLSWQTAAASALDTRTFSLWLKRSHLYLQSTVGQRAELLTTIYSRNVSEMALLCRKKIGPEVTGAEIPHGRDECVGVCTFLKTHFDLKVILYFMPFNSGKKEHLQA